MRSAGYTLIELLVVLTIISIIGVVGYVSYKEFAANQVAKKALGQVQTLLRLAQTNATTSTVCSDNQTVVGPWLLVFNQDQTSIDLVCGTSRKTYTLENAQIDEIKGSGCLKLDFPVTLSYSTGIGTLTISPPDTCLLQFATSVIFTISNTKNPGTPPKTFNISKGGAINVE